MKTFRLTLSIALLAATIISPAVAAPKKPMTMVGSVPGQLQTGDTVTLNASTAAAAPINRPQGTAPTAPANGDCWTTSAGFYCRINGVSVGPSAGPTWSTYTNIYNPNRFDIGGYPLKYQFSGNTKGIAEAVTGTVNIPSSSAAGNHSSGVAGYAVSASTSQGSVGSFGYGGILANGVSAWGANFLVQNCPGANSCAVSTGYTNTVLYGIEVDVNLNNLPGGTAPNAAARGIYIIGASQQAPTSPIFYALDIDSPGIGNTPKTKWAAAISVEDGSSTNALLIGTLAVGNSQGSSPITMNARTAGGALLQSTLATDAAGNVTLNAPAGSAAQVGALGQCALKAVAASFNQSTCSLYNSGFYRPGTYTVSALATLDSSPQAGDSVTVTDATTCTANTTVSGGGSLSCAVIYSGTAWKAVVTR